MTSTRAYGLLPFAPIDWVDCCIFRRILSEKIPFLFRQHAVDQLHGQPIILMAGQGAERKAQSPAPNI